MTRTSTSIVLHPLMFALETSGILVCLAIMIKASIPHVVLCLKLINTYLKNVNSFCRSYSLCQIIVCCILASIQVDIRHKLRHCLVFFQLWSSGRLKLRLFQQQVQLLLLVGCRSLKKKLTDLSYWETWSLPVKTLKCVKKIPVKQTSSTPLMMV